MFPFKNIEIIVVSIFLFKNCYIIIVYLNLIFSGFFSKYDMSTVFYLLVLLFKIKISF